MAPPSIHATCWSSEPAPASAVLSRSGSHKAATTSRSWPGGWADYPVPAWGTVSLGKVALRSAATMLGADLAGDGIRVASITIAGQIQPGTPFSPDQIAEKYWSVVQSGGTWQSEFRFDGT